ncbi:MAG: hypothetical protein RIR96_1282 [Bacteroidota bacterium]
MYHITSLARWNSAQSEGWIDADSLHSEGFIHMCYEHQLEGVLQRHFAGKTDLIKLTLDEESLKESTKLEYSAGLKDSFPHCYGTIPLTSIKSAEPIKSSS